MGCSSCGGGSCWSGGPPRDLTRAAFVPPLPPATDDQAPLPAQPGGLASRPRLDGERRRIERLRRDLIRKSLGKS